MGPDTPTEVLRATDQLAARLTRTEVQRGASSIPGREIVQVLTEIPVGVEPGWHTHPGEAGGYILGGLVEMRSEVAETLMLHAGDGVILPPRTRHDARDLAKGTGRIART